MRHLSRTDKTKVVVPPEVRLHSSALSFDDSLRDFTSSSSTPQKWVDLAGEYNTIIAPALLAKSDTKVGRHKEHDLIKLIEIPPRDLKKLGLSKADQQIIEFSRNLESPPMSTVFARVARYLIEVDRKSPEYHDLEVKFLRKHKPVLPEPRELTVQKGQEGMKLQDLD